jgi:V/A-type H+-transporting ATPase subunit D
VQSSSRVVPTRTELLASRRAAVLAGQGRDVLSDKRTALVQALQQRSEALVRRMADARSAAAAARASLDDAGAAVGPAALVSASYAASSRVGVNVEASTVAGVVIVDITSEPVLRAPLERGYAAVTTDPAVDLAARAYEGEVVELLELAALELTVRRLANEIARTTRQVNALEFVVVPRLREQAARIATALDEREREEAARLRRARSRVAAARGARGSPAPGTVAGSPDPPSTTTSAQPDTGVPDGTERTPS